MTLAEISVYRLASQQLTSPEVHSATEMVEWFGGMQGQEYAQTKWGLGLRLPDLSDYDIERDFREGKILRTHLLRPTWHFVSARDIRWMLRLTAPRVHAANKYMYHKLELDRSIFSRCNDILINALQGGKQLTRNELNEYFQQHKIFAKGHRLSYIMMNAELEGFICSGARRGNQFTYALLEERVKPEKSVTAEEALAMLTARYFKSRGPATVKDYSRWSGLTLTDCRKGIEMIADGLTRENINGIEYYFAADFNPGATAPDEVHLLPAYDEILMSYKNREAFYLCKNSLGNKAVLKYDCMILCGGQVIGTWKRTIKTRHIQLQHHFFSPLTEHQKKAFIRGVKRYERFKGLKADLL